VDVWLPEGYSDKRKYAVLYMQDGQMLFDSTITWNKQEWQVDELIGLSIINKQIQPIIIVAVWNVPGQRFRDYFPGKAIQWLPTPVADTLLQKDLKGASSSDAYLLFIVQELKPFIDSAFSSRKNRKHTFIAGSSMGGLISMYAICEYPRVFGGAACLSTHWPGGFNVKGGYVPAAFQQYLQAYLPSRRKHKLYFDYGTETLDALYEPHQLKVDSILRAKKFNADHWITRKFVGADHSERAWGNRMVSVLQFLIGR